MTSIYLRFAVAGRCYNSTEVPVTWYKISSSLEEPQTTFVSGIPPLPTNAVALGSVIYVLELYPDDKYTASREVYYFDTRFPHLGWKKAPSLNRSRGLMCLVPNNGKMYAVGYDQVDVPGQQPFYDREKWCEVFDPFLNIWLPLSGPDAETLAEEDGRGGHRTGAAEGGGAPKGGHKAGAGAAEGVIVESAQGRFWYDEDCNMWRKMCQLTTTTRRYRAVIDRDEYRSYGAVIDGVEYFFSRWVQGHNLGEGVPFLGVVRGLKGAGVSPVLRYMNDPHGAETNFPRAFVVGVGNGRLCLVHQTPRGLHCTRFRVSAHSDDDEEFELLATVEAFRIYPDHRYDPFLASYKGKPQLNLCLVI